MTIRSQTMRRFDVGLSTKRGRRTLISCPSTSKNSSPSSKAWSTAINQSPRRAWRTCDKRQARPRRSYGHPDLARPCTASAPHVALVAPQAHTSPRTLPRKHPIQSSVPSSGPERKNPKNFTHVRVRVYSTVCRSGSERTRALQTQLRYFETTKEVCK